MPAILSGNMQCENSSLRGGAGTWAAPGGGAGQGEQRGLVLRVHSGNSWPCYWTATTHDRGPATAEY